MVAGVRVGRGDAGAGAELLLLGLPGLPGAGGGTDPAAGRSPLPQLRAPLHQRTHHPAAALRLRRRLAARLRQQDAARRHSGQTEDHSASYTLHTQKTVKSFERPSSFVFQDTIY